MDASIFSTDRVSLDASNRVKINAEERREIYDPDGDLASMVPYVWKAVKDHLDEIMPEFDKILMAHDGARKAFEEQQAAGTQTDGKHHFKYKFNSPIDQQWVDAAAFFGLFAVEVGLPSHLAIATVNVGYTKCLELVLKAYSKQPRKLDKATNAIHRLNSLETEIVVASMGQVRADLEKKRVDEQAKLFREHVGATVDAITEQSRSLGEKTSNMRNESHRVRDCSTQVSTAGSQTAAAMVEASKMLGRLTDTADRALDGARQNTITANDAVTKVNETAQTVNELQEKGRAMDSMLELIRVIAKKTNLLAFNVTVEAARIGDAGRSFAVIAQEVKNLAIQSSNVTEEVAQQIADVHSATAQTVDSIGHLNKMMVDVGTNANNILQSLDEQSSSILVISSAVDETSMSANLVSGNMEDVRQASELLTRDAEEIDSAYRNVDNKLQRLKQGASEFLQQITQDEVDSCDPVRTARAA